MLFLFTKKTNSNVLKKITGVLSGSYLYFAALFFLTAFPVDFSIFMFFHERFVADVPGIGLRVFVIAFLLCATNETAAYFYTLLGFGEMLSGEDYVIVLILLFQTCFHLWVVLTLGIIISSAISIVFIVILWVLVFTNDYEPYALNTLLTLSSMLTFFSVLIVAALFSTTTLISIYFGFYIFITYIIAVLLPILESLFKAK